MLHLHVEGFTDARQNEKLSFHDKSFTDVLFDE